MFNVRCAMETRPSGESVGSTRRLDRRPIARGRTRPSVPLSSKYKTEMCHYQMELMHCPFGEQCTYAHARAELRHIERHPKHKTQACRDFSTVGFCPFGARCSFIHAKPEAEISNFARDTDFLRPPTASSGYSSRASSISPCYSRTSSASDLSDVPGVCLRYEVVEEGSTFFPVPLPLPRRRLPVFEGFALRGGSGPAHFQPTSMLL